MPKRMRRGLVVCVVIALTMGPTAVPPPAVAGSDAGPGPAASGMSRTEVMLAATFLGAGTALMVSSAFVEGKYERITGYRDVGGGFEPIVTKGGADTGGMLIAGAALIFVGLCFVVSPVLQAPDGGAGAAAAESDGAPLKLAMPALDGRGTAVGLSYSF